MRSRLIISVFAVLVVAAVVTFSTSSASAAQPVSVASACREQQAQAALDGFFDFSCRGVQDHALRAGLSSGSTKARSHHREAVVTVANGNLLSVETTDTDVQRAEGVPAPQMQTMNTFTGIPAGCWTSWVCTATITNSFSAYTSFFGMPGTSYKCAWMSYRQVYDVYAPWSALLNVRTPQVTGGATWPCSTTQLSNWMQMGSMPYNATTAGVLGYQINLFWQGVGVISSHPGVTRGAWFDGRYNYSGVSYGN